MNKGTKLHRDKFSRGNQIAQRHFCKEGNFCTRIKRNKIKILSKKIKDKLIKKRYWSRVRIRELGGNSDSKKK